MMKKLQDAKSEQSSPPTVTQGVQRCTYLGKLPELHQQAFPPLAPNTDLLSTVFPPERGTRALHLFLLKLKDSTFTVQDSNALFKTLAEAVRGQV